MSEYQNNNIAMSWDSEIENDSSFTLLPEGDYDFIIADFERKRFEGSAKMSPCPQAALTIKLFDRADPSKGSTTVTHNLFLNYKCEGLLCSRQERALQGRHPQMAGKGRQRKAVKRNQAVLRACR